MGFDFNEEDIKMTKKDTYRKKKKIFSKKSRLKRTFEEKKTNIKN